MAKIYLFMVFFGGLVLVLLAIILLRGFRKNEIPPGSHDALKLLESLPSHLECSVSCSFILSAFKSASFKGKFEGYEFSLNFNAYERRWQGRFYLTLYSDFQSKLNIFIYTWNQGHVFSAKKIKTGYKDFDKQFVIYSNEPNKAKQLFYDDTTRNSLINITKQGWDPPHIVKNKITTDRDFQKGEIIDHMLIKETLKNMIILSENIKKHVFHTN